jgi:hypothetical protein
VKKIFVLFIFAVIISACDKSKSSSSDTSFRIKAGTLTKFASPINTYNYTFISGRSGNSIIYNGTINGTNYVGLALGDNSDDSFGLYIYFPSASFPSVGSTVDVTGTAGAIIKAKNSSTDYTVVTGTLSLQFVSRNESTYVTYTINPIASSLTIAGNAVTFVGNITALFVGTNP